jgi:hypothetical protein
LESLLTRLPQQAPETGRSDLKAILLKLVDQLRQQVSTYPLPSTGTAKQSRATTSTLKQDAEILNAVMDLLKPVENALTRTQLLQLQSAERQGGLDLLFEIPIRCGDSIESLQLRIQNEEEHRSEGHATGESTLSVQFSFRFDHLGAIRATLRLTGEYLSTCWWAERSTTVALINDHLPLLRQRLLDIGLQVTSMECRQGQPTQAIDELTILRRGFIDEKA